MALVKPVILQCLEHAKRCGDSEVEAEAEAETEAAEGIDLVGGPLALPAPLPGEPDAALSAHTYEHAVRKKAISKDLGYGLVATEDIPAGSVIFADRVACIGAEELARWKTPEAGNKLVAAKVKAMGEEWHRAFLALPNHQPRVGNEYAQIWRRYQMVAVRKRARVMVVGPKMGLVNHSCMPNAFLYYALRFPKNKRGEEDKSKQPTIGRAVVRASVDIKPGDEITISYFYPKGEHSVRQLMSSMYCQFWCYCPQCSQPGPEIEKMLERYYQLQLIFEDADIVYKRPAVAYKTAYSLIKLFKDLKVNDPRVIQPWIFCAMIAGFNSDLGRALQFLIKAHTLILQLQCPNGHLYDRVSCWMQTIALMPGFGATTRGLSSMTDGYHMARDREHFHDVLFMLDAEPDEYIRLHRYRRLPDCQVKEGESRFAVRFDAEDMSRKRFEDEEPDPVKIKPWWVIPEGDRATEQNAKPQKKKKGSQEGKEQRQRKRAVNKIPKPRNPDCIEPEKDFLDICRELLTEFLAEERKKKEQTKNQEEQEDPEGQQEDANRPGVRRQGVRLQGLRGRLKPNLQISLPFHQRVHQPMVQPMIQPMVQPTMRKGPAKKAVVVNKAPVSSFKLEESATLEM
ncbi:SET domain-containing protein [Aspergillus clavatus NRRL 1]|uniref:SET domain-containing protein n=1 Tax=Aspergillus clavatus (strain ATCC 1007 / CBS 513.65 / DSM 816 / NCTC 3887 / NRRL 1 / QM 1276 / 107) TaxID=344612 RepID=A1CSU1_ASPCL|nr:uncharacterized protein ACLA_080620 [Aspergillus clavatus NRRL 1]EAW06378.1 hypothetical protein ACLA_080620 [Aspergillus clavatus NRRL 1]